ncbi:hypothetical protein NDU88_010869 [Pleurodeles waltl]|uniref:Uncharacterized protein n=1 Tax=Pleurodeles waltl TaxID=8319 RepID=A0AAV7QVY0_PLEWA|nr:hypothetical protein NDU88_010869 [Pleurodeles waltl]
MPQRDKGELHGRGDPRDEGAAINQARCRRILGVCLRDDQAGARWLAGTPLQGGCGEQEKEGTTTDHLPGL